ncbi:site-specific integrase [Streptomyces sp. NPDC002521]
MRPVEPLSSWLRRLAWRRTAAKTMRTYAYAVLMLLGFLQARGRDLRSATESDIVQFEHWRRARRWPVARAWTSVSGTWRSRRSSAAITHTAPPCG